jgi:transcription elongation factor Elf1
MDQCPRCRYQASLATTILEELWPRDGKGTIVCPNCNATFTVADQLGTE